MEIVGGSRQSITSNASASSGDYWVEDGIIYRIPVPTENGRHRVDEDAYRKRIEKIAPNHGK
jgi:hypothetical protein